MSIPVVTVAGGGGGLAGTPGAVPFIGSTGVRLTSDGAALSWDATNAELDVAGPGANAGTINATATDANGIAVTGAADGAAGVGVGGNALAGFGVVGAATSGTGVQGAATTGVALHADVGNVAGTGLKVTGPISMSGKLIRALVNNVEKFVVDALGGILGAYLDLPEAGAPANPSAGTQRIYTKSSDHRLYRRDSSGAETALDLGGSIAATQVPYGSAANTLTGNAHLIYNLAGGGGSGGGLVSELIGAGGAAVAGYGDTGYGGDFEATGAAGLGVYAYASGAGGIAVQAEAGATTVIPLQGLAPTSQTADLLQLLVNGSTKFAVGASGRPRFVSSPPSTAGDTGTTGEIAWDSGFLYLCTATNTWKRVAIATW